MPRRRFEHESFRCAIPRHRPPTLCGSQEPDVGGDALHVAAAATHERQNRADRRRAERSRPDVAEPWVD